MSDVTIWHNPGCGSSKNALSYLTDRGIEPTVYLYLKEKPNREAIAALLELPASGLLRPGEALAEQLGLYGDGVDENAVLDALASHAKLIQRPVVVSERGAVIARPKTRIDDIVP
jgi:arsenate reductase (glutaredoxin)